MARQRWLRSWLIRLLVLGVVGVAVVAVAAVRSAQPDDDVRSIARPVEDAVFVTVEEGRLTSRVVTRGNVIAASPTTVTVTEAPPDRDPVLTSVPVIGAAVNEGDVLYELSGRPVIALMAAVPAYRDLRPGDTGPDVAGLQAVLQRLQLYSKSVDGTYGVSTAAALAGLYASRGYEPIAPSADLVAHLDQLIQQRSQLAAQVPQDDASAESVTAQTRQLDRQIADARAALGTPFIRREFVHLPALPSVVQTVSQPVGAVVEPGSSLLSVSSGAVAVRIDFLEPGFERLIGREVELDLQPGEQPSVGAVTGQVTNAEGEAALVVSSDALTAEQIGTNVRVTIIDHAAIGVTLLVPRTAITTAGSGQSYVDKQRGEGRLVRVPVTVIAEADGTVALTVGDRSELAVGDLIRLSPP